MFPGILSKKMLFAFFLLAPLYAQAQFTHRLELHVESMFSTETDKVNFSKDYIGYYEDNTRNGTGFSLSLKYNFKNSPFSVIIGRENTVFNTHTIRTNIRVSDHSQKLKITSYRIRAQYTFFNHSTFKPFAYLGVNYNRLNFNRSTIRYNYNPAAVTEFIDINEITWGYDVVQSDFNALGVSGGIGLQIRVTDKFGLNGRMNLDYLSQSKSNWVGDPLLIKTYTIGAHLRLFKRKEVI